MFEAEDLEAHLNKLQGGERLNYVEQNAAPRFSQVNETSFVDEKGTLNPKDIQVDASMRSPTSLLPSKYGGARKMQDDVAGIPISAAGLQGEIKPDFSGYDSFEDRLNKMQRDPHWAEILGGSVGAIAGVVTGNAGAGLKASGEQLTGTAARYQKKSDDIEKMLLEIEGKRAASLAKGKKGAAGPAGSWRLRIYEDDEGNKRVSQQVNPETGENLRKSSDPYYDSESVKTITQKNWDGSEGQVLTTQNGVNSKVFGRRDPKLDLQRDAEGNLQGVNPFDVASPQEVGGQRSGFNQTSLGLSKEDSGFYDGKEKEYTKAAAPSAMAYSASAKALTALEKGDNGGAIVALKEIVRALEQGKMSDQDYIQVANKLGPGWEQWLEKKEKSILDGVGLTNPEREELKGIATQLLTGARNEQSRQVGIYNSQISKRLPKESFNRLQFRPTIKTYGREEQKEQAEEIIDMQSEFGSQNRELWKDHKTGITWWGVFDPNGVFKPIKEYTP